MDTQVKYILWIKGGYYFALTQDGTILYDSERNYRSDSGEWRITYITKRYHSQRPITLDQAARGADLGQGWVHDLDHGTHRLWCMPKHHRAVRVAPASTDYRIPQPHFIC